VKQEPNNTGKQKPNNKRSLEEEIKVAFFGQNQYGQCNIPPELKNKTIKNIFLGGYHSAIWFQDGSVSFFGRNQDGQCNIPPEFKNKPIKNIFLGHNHSAIWFQDGSVSFFG